MDMDVVGNKERLLKGILDGETTTDIEPAGNEERLLYGILKGENESNIEPASRVERLLKAILENGGGGGGGTGVVTKTIAGTIANPFSVEEANEIWNAIHGGTGDAHLTFTLPSFGSVTARFGAEPYEEGVNVLLASITAPAGNQVAALCLMYLVSADTIFLAQKLAYAITPSSKPSVMDASALISNNLDTETSVTEYEQSTLVEPLSVAENGTYTAEEGTAYSPVTVDVAPNVGSKSITANGNYSSSSDNLDGYSSVAVNVPQTTVESKSIMANGTYTAESGKAFSPVTVNVPVPALETKSVTANGNYDAPSGKAWNRVEVNVAAVSKLPQVVDRTVTEITAEDLNGATSVADYAFYLCENLASISIPSGVTSIGTSAFRRCSALTNVVLPAGVTSLGTEAFRECSNLTSINIPSGVTSIPDSAFANCTKLENLVLPANVTSIGTNTFIYCQSLTSMVIPSSVTSIGSASFSYCRKLRSVTIEASTPPTLASKNAFNGVHADFVIYVPAASVSTYQSAANWSTYASKIQAIPNS